MRRSLRNEDSLRPSESSCRFLRSSEPRSCASLDSSSTRLISSAYESTEKWENTVDSVPQLVQLKPCRDVQV